MSNNHIHGPYDKRYSQHTGYESNLFPLKFYFRFSKYLLEKFSIVCILIVIFSIGLPLVYSCLLSGPIKLSDVLGFSSINTVKVLNFFALLSAIYFFVERGLEINVERKNKKIKQQFYVGREKIMQVPYAMEIMSQLKEKLELGIHLGFSKSPPRLLSELEYPSLESDNIKGAAKRKRVSLPVISLGAPKNNKLETEISSPMYVKSRYDKGFISWLNEPLEKKLFNGETFTLVGYTEEENCSKIILGLSDYYSMLSNCDRFFYGLTYRLGKNSFIYQLGRKILGSKNKFLNIKDIEVRRRVRDCFREKQYGIFTNSVLETWIKELQNIISIQKKFFSIPSEGRDCVDPQEDKNLFSAIGISCSILVKCKDNNNKTYYTTFVHDKSDKSNVIERFHVIPAGMFQPGTKTRAKDDRDIHNSVLREVAAELYGIEEGKSPVGNKHFVDHYRDLSKTLEFHMGHHNDKKKNLSSFDVQVDEAEKKPDCSIAEKMFCEFITFSSEFKVVDISIDVLRSHTELNCLMTIDDDRFDFQKHLRNFKLNFETNDFLTVVFRDDWDFQDSLKDAMIITNSLEELPLYFVGTGISTLFEAYKEAKSKMSIENRGEVWKQSNDTVQYFQTELVSKK